MRYTPSEGTFYAFISIKETGLSSEEFAMKLLEENRWWLYRAMPLANMEMVMSDCLLQVT